jgi:hypothetical protein
MLTLASLLAGKFGVPTSQGQLAATAALTKPDTHDAAAVASADAFASTYQMVGTANDLVAAREWVNELQISGVPAA